MNSETFTCPISGETVRSGFKTDNMSRASIETWDVLPKCGHWHTLSSARGENYWTVDGVEQSTLNG